MIWRSVRLGAVASTRVSNVDKHTLEGEPVVRLCNYVDVYKNETIHPNMPFMVATASTQQLKEFALQDGDTIITKDSETADDIGVPAYVSAAAADLVCGYHLAILRPVPTKVHPKYLFWAMKSKETASQWETLASGVTRVGLRSSDLKTVQLPMPESPDLQVAIADFLDRETAKTDALIQKQQILIAGLSELRQAVVDRIIGEATGMPGAPLRQVATIQTGITLGKTDLGPETREYPYLRVANVQVGRVDVDDIATIQLSPDLARGVMLRRGDVLMTEGGDRAALGRGSMWDGSVEPCLHQNHVFAVRPRSDRLLPEYLVYLLESEEARRYFESTRRQTTNLSSTNSRLVRAFRFTLPSREDQVRAVRSLDEATAQIAVAIAKLERLIAVSQERRTALITAAVTGQLDIATGKAA